MASSPPRRVSCPSRWRSLVCKIPIPLFGLSETNTIGYYVNGQCQCAAGQYRRDTPCKHRLALRLFHRVLDRLFDDEERYALTEELRPAPSADKAPSSGIATRYIVMIQNKPFVKFSGLLDLAHQRGLQELRVDWTFNDAELSLAHAVAVFPFGTFEDSGDATKDNVNRKVSPHFRRCALTRASARALRLALGLDMVAVEALAEE